MIRLLFCFTLVSLFLVQCDRSTSTDEASDPLVAEVYDHQLFMSDLSELIPASSSHDDSVALANAYIEQWIREQLILNQAEKSRPTDLDLQKLVEDYRSSLLRFHFEKKLIDEQLDTIVALDEINSFYEEHKSQYLLKEPILQAKIAIVDKEKDTNNRMQKLWAENEWMQIRSLCAQKNCAYFDEGRSWISLTEFRDLVPADIMSFSSIKGKKKLQESKDKYEFYLKIENFKDENETPPLEFVMDQLTKVILHKRKQQILKDLAENLYESELEKNNVKVYVKS